MGSTIHTLWRNEVELDKSANRLDEQFAVLARMLFSRFNEMMLRVDGDNVIDEDAIAVGFLEWSKFRARPDFREFMIEWFLGVALKELPPAPEPKKEPEESPALEGEGPREFGGDYGEEESTDNGDTTTGQSQPENSEAGEADEVPQG